MGLKLEQWGVVKNDDTGTEKQHLTHAGVVVYSDALDFVNMVFGNDITKHTGIKVTRYSERILAFRHPIGSPLAESLPQTPDIGKMVGLVHEYKYVIMPLDDPDSHREFKTLRNRVETYAQVHERDSFVPVFTMVRRSMSRRHT